MCWLRPGDAIYCKGLWVAAPADEDGEDEMPAPV